MGPACALWCGFRLPAWRSARPRRARRASAGACAAARPAPAGDAARRAAEAAQRAFDFAQKRYDLGLTNTIEYLTTQNTLYSSESRLASAKYDLLFKLKVIDYYLGKEIKL